MRKKFLLIIFMIMVLFSILSYGRDERRENFKYECEVKFGEFIEKVRESDQDKVEKLIKHYLKKAFNEAVYFKASKPKASKHRSFFKFVLYSKPQSQKPRASKLSQNRAM